MVPYTYNMVDMEGIDLADVKDKTFPGLFDKIVESLNACGVVILYNWYCAWLPIPPQHVDVVVVEDVSVTINGMIIVNSDDTIEIPTMGGSAVLQHLLAEENRIYEPPEGVDGFDLVDVQVPSVQPVISSLSITSNGNYVAPEGVDGYSPITVSVSGGEPPLPSEYQRVEYVSMTGSQYAVFPDSVSPTQVNFNIADLFYTRAARMEGTTEQSAWGVHSNDGLTSGLFEVYFPAGASQGLAVYGGGLIKAADYETGQTGSPSSNCVYLNAAKTGYIAIGRYRTYYLNGYIYTFRIYSQNSSLKPVLLFDFVPCYRKSDNEVGFYELVTGTFLTNAGSGTFGKGPDVNSI